jgi:hypothetical protein
MDDDDTNQQSRPGQGLIRHRTIEQTICGELEEEIITDTEI